MLKKCQTICCYNFFVADGKRKYCSKSCVRIKESIAAGRNKKWNRKNTVRICKADNCKTEIAWYEYEQKLYCDEHGKVYQDRLKRERQRRKQGVNQLGNNFDCGYCKKQFIKRTPSHVYCSSKCREEWAAKRRTEQLHSKILCKCGNKPYSYSTHTKDCEKCIRKLLQKTNWILLGELPKRFNTYARFECKVCRSESSKLFWHILQSNKPNTSLNKSGALNCWACSNSNRVIKYDLKNDKGYFYLLENDLFYKYGVSYKIKNRLQAHARSNLKPILVIEFDTLQQAYNYEKLVKQFVKENNLDFTGKYNFKSSGKTETICKKKAKTIPGKWVVQLIKSKEVSNA